jgi:Hsp20/alpha crystallin family protein
LPGIDEKNVEVNLANGMLTIKGEKQDEREEKKTNYYRRERSFGSFERSFQVPDGVDLDKVDARFKNGVLTVTLQYRSLQKRSRSKLVDSCCRKSGNAGLARSGPQLLHKRVLAVQVSLSDRPPSVTDHQARAVFAARALPQQLCL